MLRYKSVFDSSVLTRPEGASEIAAWVRLPFGPQASASSTSRPPLEPILSIDGRTLYDYLSGAAPPAQDEGQDLTSGTSDERRKTNGDEAEAVSTLSEFEQHTNRAGLGAVYRDVVYFLTERGGRAELSGRSVRIATRDEPPRILATIELVSGPMLSVVLLLGAITAGSNDTEQHDFRPGQSADDLLARMEALIAPPKDGGGGAPPSREVEQGSDVSR
jgi:hypothetical protein